MSLPQQQIRFKQSRKLCLNLWSWRWLKPNISLVINFIVAVESPVLRCCMNCKKLIKQAKPSELLILLLRLFHAITVDGKNEFLRKVYLTLNRGILSIIISC